MPVTLPSLLPNAALRICVGFTLVMALPCGTRSGPPSCSAALGDEQVAAPAEKTPVASAAAPAPVWTVDDFTNKVAPILKARCFECHAEDAQESGLRLDTLAGLSTGGKAGPVVQPGVPDESPLISAIGYGDESLRMPPEKKLPQDEIDVLTAWVAAGAPHPGGKLAAAEPLPFNVEEARQFWAYQPPKLPEIPRVAHAEWVQNPVDAFVVSPLEAKGLTPNELADRITLIRRATLDLTGLPPTPEEVDSFLADASPTAFQTVLERLLQSRHYGERWGRHWLDVVRYADSNGLDENIAHGNAFRYRDYVIESLNRDKPFDQFVKEHIAGDLLASDIPLAGENIDVAAVEASRNELVTGTGFLSLGPKVLAESDKTKMLMDIIDEQIDTTGRVFLAQTYGCARCHNHKFDPVAQADYYALAGIFKSTYTMESLKTIARWHENPVATAADTAALEQHTKSIDAKKKEIEQLISATTASLAAGTPADQAEAQFPQDVKDKLTALRAEQKKLETDTPVLPAAMGVKEGTPEKTRIAIRGSHLTLGRSVNRGIPVVLDGGQPLTISENQSGRRQLADWLASPRNPLTARVMVNRIWRWHFGEGLVPSPDNFGTLGERPTHPELLDWLALQFIEKGWSIKDMHRLIMTSRTYQLSSTRNEVAERIDPANTLLWRWNIRRLEAESIRDATLAVSGLLDRTMGGSMLHVANREFLFNHTSKDETKYDSLRRSVYLPVIRNNLYDGFSLFDATDCAVPNGDRSSSTVASQALYFMNSDLMLNAGDSLARQIADAAGNDHSARTSELFRRAFGRSPAPTEATKLSAFTTSLAEQFLAEGSSVEAADQSAWSVACQSVLSSNEFVYLR